MAVETLSWEILWKRAYDTDIRISIWKPNQRAAEPGVIEAGVLAGPLASGVILSM